MKLRFLLEDNMFGKIKETVIAKPMLLRSYRPIFKTIDGEKHVGIQYKYADENRVRGSVPELLMISVKSNGYLVDIESKMYPLANIISIEWDLVDEQIKQYQSKYEWQIYFEEDEVGQMKDYEK